MGQTQWDRQQTGEQAMTQKQNNRQPNYLTHCVESSVCLEACCTTWVKKCILKANASFISLTKTSSNFSNTLTRDAPISSSSSSCSDTMKAVENQQLIRQNNNQFPFQDQQWKGHKSQQSHISNADILGVHMDIGHVYISWKTYINVWQDAERTDIQVCGLQTCRKTDQRLVVQLHVSNILTKHTHTLSFSI